MKRNAILYQMYLRPFTPEGTFKGAEKMLPHIASLGFDIVYLCPICDMDDDPDPRFWSPNHIKSGLQITTNPYRIRDYYKVDAEYGTDEDLRDFVKTAHSLGIKVLLDLVYFHCGPRAAFIEEHPDYVVCDKEGNVTCGRWNFPQLNFESLGLREYLWSNMEYFIREFDVDGYRCDVAQLVPLDFWAEGKKRMQAIKPDALLFDEGQAASYQEVFDFYYNMDFSHSLRRAVRGKITASDFVTAAKEKQAGMPDYATPAIFIDNHDTVKNVLYLGRFEAVVGHDRAEAAFVVLYTSFGIPFVYNGLEICDDQAHTLYSNRFTTPNLRINWSHSLTPAAGRRMRILRELATLRKNNLVLTEGKTDWLTVGDSDNVIAYTRSYEGKTVTVIVNVADKVLESTVDCTIAPNARVLMEHNFVITEKGEQTKFAANPGGYIVIEQ